MSDEFFMQQALREAHKALEDDEVPIGAVIVINDKIVSRGHNQVEKLSDVTAHAEILALTAAFNYLGSKYLPEASLYVTIEPCLMCAGALYWTKIARVVYGAADTKNGYRKTVGAAWPFHPKTALVSGVMEAECAKLVQDFFKAKR
jgi:tRNA(adenine34) deaminase